MEEKKKTKHAQYSRQHIRPLMDDSSRQGMGIGIIAEENKKEKKKASPHSIQLVGTRTIILGFPH